ncbi:NAD(+)/NADH kinase, partial [bacterium]|nr:NAD(+)/NADH kinase [bacterium]
MRISGINSPCLSHRYKPSPRTACELATIAAADADCSMVVAVGGDGTIREVAHGLEGSNKPLLIIPGGT